MIHHPTAAVVALLAGTSAFAQAPEKRYEAELSYSLSYRAAATREIGLNSTFGGFGPTYLRGGGAYFFGGLPVGARAEGSFETFTVEGLGLLGAERFTKRVMSFFAFGGLAGELLPLPWLRIEGDVGWGAAGLPAIVFSAGSEGGFASKMLGHTGPVLAGRADVSISPALLAELRVRAMPVSFGARFDGAGVGARDVTAGVSFGTVAMRLGALRVVAFVDYELSLMGGSASSGDFSSGQVANRFGLTLRATEGPERHGILAPRTGPGRIRGRVLAQDSGKPVAAAQVEIPGKPGTATDANGSFQLDQVGPGPVSVEVSAAGYRVAREEISVPPGGEVSESLALVRKTGPGTIRGTVRERLESGEGGAPLGGVEVTVQGRPPARSDAGGRFVLEEVGPGPVSLALSAKGYKSGEELVQVPPESEAEVSLSLPKVVAAALATFRGRVRSVKGGGVAATLRIPEAGVNTRAGADGRFSVRLPGGRYSVVFSAEGFVAQTKTVEVASGDQALYYVDLSPSEH